MTIKRQNISYACSSWPCMCTITLVALILTLPAHAGKDSKGPPLPDKDPSVLAAKAVLEEKTQEMVEAKQEVEKLRVQLGQLQSRSRTAYIKAQMGRGAGGLEHKTPEIMEAEAKVKEARMTFEALLDELHQSYQYDEAIVLRKLRKKLQDELDSEREMNEPSSKRIRELSTDLRNCERKLSKMETRLFQNDDRYIKAKQTVQQAQRDLFNQKRAASSSRIQPAQYAAPDQEKLAIIQQIKDAAALYGVKAKAHHEAKVDAKKKAYLATQKYKDWLQAEAEKKKKKNKKKKK